MKILKKRNNIKLIRILSVLVLMTTGILHINSQIDSVANQILNSRGEICIQFKQPSNVSLNILTRMMSIDKYRKSAKGNEITAYLSRREFVQFEKSNIPYEIQTFPLLKMSGTMCPDLPGVKNWNCYPTYDQYLIIMQSFASDHPELCKLVEFGQSVDGRKLLAVKISDNVNESEEEPEFLYTSSMHGDEITGYVLMLRLIEYLLYNYNKDSRITDLVNTTEIWINPLSNPDGTYSGGNSDVYGATRFNSNGIDLNRNYPGFTYVDDYPNTPRYPIVTVDKPYGIDWQPENVAMMDFMKNHHFVFAANFHGGVEVVNYPWDAWLSREKTHPDDIWYQEISHEYADTVHDNSSNYMVTLDGLSNPSGITNGGDWYTVYGGRQDYVNYYLHSRETTIEISNIKMPVATSLPNYWNYNYRSFLNYINRVHTGIYGKVTDENGIPLHAKISLIGHDSDSSEVYSSSENGMYYRMIQDGTYQVRASIPGYSSVDSSVIVANSLPANINIVMKKNPNSVSDIQNDLFKLHLHNNPVQNFLKIDLEMKKSANCEIFLFDVSGRKVYNQTLTLSKGINQKQFIIEDLSPGVYFCTIWSENFSEKFKFVKSN